MLWLKGQKCNAKFVANALINCLQTILLTDITSFTRTHTRFQSYKIMCVTSIKMFSLTEVKDH